MSSWCAARGGVLQRLAGRAAMLVTLALAPLRVDAQSTGPTFLLQPGLLSADFVSSDAGLGSTTGFNVRFETRFRIGPGWLNPLVGASVMPYGTSGLGGRNLNAPTVFFGNAFPLVRSGRTNGWLTLQLPLLVYHTYGGGSENTSRLYGRDLHVQLASYVHIGRKTLQEFGPNWMRLDAYAFLEQNLTPNRDPVTGRKDWFNPTALFGLSVSFGDPEGLAR
ncbi:MAG TPA: hypothetical protein VLE53_06170 [Gemmatimonadaceae bacterium]|nr:hypothetical protein [Gemmatimonadaceae bacterium]